MSVRSQLLEWIADMAGRASDTLADIRRTANFLRGRLEFRPRPDDIYVVTYPRSGTTWMQFMLYLLTTEGSLDFVHLNEVSPWFERSLAIGWMRPADFERYPGPRILKSHLPHGWLPSPGRYVVVVRDGRDVATSYYHFYRSHLGFRGDFATFFERFLAGDLQYGSWFKHVEGWQRHASDPSVFLVRYEDLVADRARVLSGLAQWLGIAVEPGKLERVVEASSFEAMKAYEDKFDHVTAVLLERRLHRGSFIRSGQSGTGKQTLETSQIVAFEQHEASARIRPTLELSLPRFLH